MIWAEGDADLRTKMEPAEVEALGSVIVRTPWEADITVTPTSPLVSVADAVLVAEDTCVMDPSKPLPGSWMMPASVMRTLTMRIRIGPDRSYPKDAVGFAPTTPGVADRT